MYAQPLGQTGYQNPCGGRGWRYTEAEQIAVEGLGVPRYEPGHARFDQCAATWENFRCELTAAAARHGVPASWLLALACVETGPWSGSRAQQAAMVSPAGALGVMQIMPATAKGFGYRPDDMLDARKNIDVGAELVAQLDARVSGGLPAICGPYNSGQLCCDSGGCGPGCQNDYRICTHSDYPGTAIRYNNTALEYFDLSPCARFGTLLGFGLLAVGVGGMIKWADRR